MEWLVMAVTMGIITAMNGPKGLVLYVSIDGDDGWSGRLPEPNAEENDGPFATLERARDEIRRLKAEGKLKGSVTVFVRGGRYYLDKPFKLTSEDSGTPDTPILYRAYPGEEVRLIGGKPVSNWQPVTDRSILGRLDESARGKVMQADLRSIGITDYGRPSGGGLELFFNDKPMTLARYPNEGFMHIADVVAHDGHQIHGIKGSKIGKFYYEGDRPKRWVGEKDPWLHGYWFWDWSDQRHRIESIDTERRIISVAPPYHSYGYRKGQWFYAYNILAELDSPGEWYLDRESGILYFWPPGDIENGCPTVSTVSTLVEMRDVSHVTLQGFTLEVARGNAITIANGEEDRIIDCTIRNIHGWAVRISGGKGDKVTGCEIYNIGHGGIALSGGDRRRLIPAGHLAENNHIHHYGLWKRMYTPAVSLSGVGNRARHNLIHDAPHQAIAFSGNDHLIEFNEIHHVCLESNDAGAIYSGRDWTWRGTVIRYNFFHHINGFQNRGCMGVYLDDMLCGTIIYGNVFYRVTRAAFIGGGRDNIVENNIFVECNPAVHVDARAMGWASYHVNTTMVERLNRVPYKKPPWSERYPELVNILEDEPAAPKGNRIIRNVCWRGKWLEIEGKAKPYVRFEENLIDQNPLFVDAEKMDFRLRPDSPAYKIGFKPIPFEKIGLYRSNSP
ncbi:right-handed parallel beta-helix repeat-containing protein [Candidatus Poribacteria bacterium]|nr:right-handed parallel beta-helix repeat-containing protein [Candidatus Poribacteria bacterium]